MNIITTINTNMENRKKRTNKTDYEYTQERIDMILKLSETNLEWCLFNFPQFEKQIKEKNKK